MTRPLLALAAPAALLLALIATPASAAAGGCSLVATVVPGRSIELSGAGFPAAADATIAIVRNDVPEPPIRSMTDAAGALAVSVDAGPGNGGAYSFTATAGGCSAMATAVAVETAGGGGGTASGGGAGSTPNAGGGAGATANAGGAGATMPPTDTTVVVAKPDLPPGSVPGAIVLALGGLAVVGLRLASTRRGRRP